MKVPFIVRVFPAPTASLPDVSVRSPWLTMLLPIVAVPPPVIWNDESLLVVPAVVGLRNNVPSEPVAPTVTLEVVEPVRY